MQQCHSFGPLKIQRLMGLLAITPDVKAVVDSEQNAIDLSTAALASKRKLKVAIDVNVGQNRTGLGTPEDIVALAQIIAKQKGLDLIGLQGYGGNNQHVMGFENRKAREVASNEKVVAARHALDKAFFNVLAILISFIALVALVNLRNLSVAGLLAVLIIESRRPRVVGRPVEILPAFTQESLPRAA